MGNESFGDYLIKILLGRDEESISGIVDSTVNDIQGLENVAEKTKIFFTELKKEDIKNILSILLKGIDAIDNLSGENMVNMFQNTIEELKFNYGKSRDFIKILRLTFIGMKIFGKERFKRFIEYVLREFNG